MPSSYKIPSSLCQLNGAEISCVKQTTRNKINTENRNRFDLNDFHFILNLYIIWGRRFYQVPVRAWNITLRGTLGIPLPWNLEVPKWALLESHLITEKPYMKKKLIYRYIPLISITTLEFKICQICIALWDFAEKKSVNETSL